MSNRLNNLQTVAQSIVDIYGMNVTRAQFADYVAKTGDAAAWTVYRKASDAGRGLRDLSALLNGTVSAPKVARVSIAKSRLAPASEPRPAAVAMPATTSVDDGDSTLTLSVVEGQSKADILARIQTMTREASALAAIPSVSRSFVPFGDYDVVRQIIRSGLFHPIFITGLSGNGKTFQIQQACAAEKREFIRVNVSAETDEDDLIGGFRLKAGETVFELGPVVVAMLRGSVLLIDEIDLASPKILCLQSILEGGALVIKKLGITITPASGFTVFATANTKGRGSDDGKFVGANLLNEAFLERFPITIEQAYPTVKIEQKILSKTYAELGGIETPTTTALFARLATWADGIRATFFEEGVDDLISTRRLVHIVKTYHIFGNEAQALKLCLNRFDTATQAQFIDLYAKLTPEPVDVVIPPVTVAADGSSDVFVHYSATPSTPYTGGNIV